MELTNAVSQSELQLPPERNEDYFARECAVRRELNRMKHPRQGLKRGKRIAPTTRSSKGPASNNAAL